MKYKKNILVFAMILIFITGCSEKEVTPQTSIKKDTSKENKVENAESKAEHLSYEITDNMKIEADVLPYQKDVQSYTAVEKEFSAEKLTKYFFSDISKVKEYENPNGADLEAKDGSTLFVGKGRFHYSAGKSYDDIKYLIQGAYSSELNYRTKNSAKIQVLSEEKAVKNILSEVEKLYEPDESERLHLLAGVKLDAKKLLKRQELEIDKFDLQSDIESGKYSKIDAAKIPNDCYFMVLGISQNGIPLLGAQEPYISTADEDALFQNTYMEVMADKHGIKNINVVGAYSLKVKEENAILSPREACKTVEKKYDMQILTSEQVIVNVWLEYVFIPDSQAEDMLAKGTMQPYWCFEIVEDGDTKESSAVRINAVSGEDLAYGG